MIELFQKIDFFSGLENKILKKLGDAAITRQYGRDEPIVRQGEMGLGLYIIVRGRVKVEREQGGTITKVAELGPEQFFAEMSIVDNKPRSATVTTLEDTECLLLTRDSFVSLMRKYPEIPIRMARLLAERLRAADEKLAAALQPGSPAAASAPPKRAEVSTPAPAASRAAGADSVPPSAPSTPSNGNSPASQTGDAGAKAKIQGALLDAFQRLYTMKAFTRFSVAVLGCPVEGDAPNLIEQIRIGDVKALLVPADEAVKMQIAAKENGSFTLHVFVPTRSEPVRFGPVPIRPEDRFQLLLNAPAVSLYQGDRLVNPVYGPFQTE